jgi:peptide/nickel transport system substrate-binding protein
MIKKSLSILLMAALMLGVLSGCGGQGGATQPATAPTSAAPTSGPTAATQAPDSGQPKSGGILKLSLPASPRYLDPIQYTGTYESQIIRSVCDTLVDYKMDLSGIKPNLATEWTISEDGREYTFKLRQDIYFHPGQYQDGRQLTAEDIKYSLERSARESSMNRLDMLDYCEVLGDFEVKCVLKDANAVFLTALTDAGNSIVPREEVEGWGADFGTHLVGTGPFILKEFKLDQEAVTVRNDKYWAVTPYLDGVNFMYINDHAQAANALKTGDLNLATSLQGEAVQIVRDDPNLVLNETAGLHIAYLYMNQVNGPTADKRVRDAITMAINREDLVAGVYPYGEAQLASVPLPPGSWGYDKSLESAALPYDPARAKALLTEAGYPDGLSVKLYISNTAFRIKMATIIQQYVKQNINVDVEIIPSEWGTFSEIASSGNADIYGMSWTWYPDPFFFLNKLFYSGEIGALGNGAGFKNAEVDKLLEDALVETDQAKRADMYKRVLKIVIDANPIFIYANENVTDGATSNVHDYIQRADNVIVIASDEVNVWLS